MVKTIAIVWLWYVWLPLAYHFAKAWYQVIWLDISEEKLAELRSGYDSTNEIGEKIKDVLITYTNNKQDLIPADMIVVTVPTPINENKDPDYTPLISASTMIWSVLRSWQIVVYESTVDPWATEEICLPLLEKTSGLSCPKDFTIWYSPERINPWDTVNTLDKIVKIVSGIDENTLRIISQTYCSIIKVWVYEASSIKVAEAAKIIENTQRDINIGFMNELSKICDKLWINTYDVIEAMWTKRNALKFTPGLVWGHCIWVDPYYLAKKAQKLGINPELILAGRRTNDEMAIYIANQTIKLLIKAGKKIQWAKILVMWLTFKENVPDFRNSKIGSVINELKDFGLEITWYDPYAKEAKQHTLDELCLDTNEVTYSPQNNWYDGIIYVQDHKEFSLIDMQTLLNENWVLFDVKGKFRKTWFTFYKSL